MKSIKKQIILLFTFLIFGISNAQENQSSLLWRIEGDDIKTSYLFGTIHMLPQKDFKIKEKVQKAFDASEIVVLELDMDDPSFMKDAMKYSYLNEDENIKSYMDDNEYKLLDDFLKENLKVGMAQFSNAKPFLLMSSMLMSFIGEQLASYEFTLINMSKKSNKEIRGLETFASQVAAFDTQSYEEQIDGLIEMIEEYDEYSKIYKDLVEFYKEEDIYAIYKNSKIYFNENKELEEKLLNERNRNWIPEMEKLSKKNKVFYAVGAAHLGGEYGVIKLLRKSGYTVTPIFN